MIPHFTLNRGKREYLIIRVGDEFHIIDCNEALTREKRAAVLESGCTPAQMQAMGLSGTTIPKRDIKAITVTGCGCLDDVIFYLHRKKLAFWFPKAYDQHKVDDFFRGIPRKQYKTRRRLKGGKNCDWRAREQNPDLYKKLRPVGWGWNILCIGMIAWPFVVERFYIRWYGWMLLGMCMIALLLDIFLPEYFTLLPKRRNGYDGKRERAPTIALCYGLMGILAPFAILCAKGYHLFSWHQVLPGALILSAVAGAVLLLFCREFQEDLSEGIVIIILALFFNFAAFIPHFNHVLGPELTPCTASVTGTHKSTGGKGPDSYYCTVVFQDGRELDVEVSREAYDAAEIGDTLNLQVGTGFFGVDYAIDG